MNTLKGMGKVSGASHATVSCETAMFGVTNDLRVLVHN